MLQMIVYSLLIFLTLLAICDIIGSCMKPADASEETKKKPVLWSAPYSLVKNRLKGIKTLKEEVHTPQVKPPTISETV